MVTEEKIGLVLEGGGMRGIYTAGVLDVFMDHGIVFDGVIGVSAGAIHGSTYVANQRGRNIRYYKKYCNDKRMMSYRNYIFTGNIAEPKFCYDTLPNQLDPFDYDTFQKSEMKFYVTCSNVETGKAEYIKIHDMREEVDALRASASLPFLSRIVPYRGMKLLDGGYTDSIPVQAFRKLGFACNVVVLTQHDGYVKQPEYVKKARRVYRKYPAFAEAIANRHVMYNQTLQEIRDLEKDGEIFVIRPSRELKIGHVVREPEKLQEVYEVGVRDAREQLPEMQRWIRERAGK